MKVITITDARANLARVLDTVVDDAEETVIPRPGGKAVVIVSLDEWNAMRETLHVLGDTPDQARRLLDSIAALERGDAVERELIDPDTLGAQDGAAAA